jgi:RNA polymerase sigma-70 factor (ECF subfamily)
MEAPKEGAFNTTRWSVVMAAGAGSSESARAAVEKLCRSYWFPLYAFGRRLGNSPEDAEDLTQEFFARFLARDHFALADRACGRFRTFLLTSLKRFQTDEWRRGNRVKRDGGVAFVSTGAAEAESRYSAEPRHELSPDRLFDRRWAEALLERVLDQLRQDYSSTGRAGIYTQLQQFLWGRNAEMSYAEMGRQLGLNEGAVKVAVHRLRQRFRDLLRAEVARTVESPDQVEDELQHLLGVFAS